MRVECDPRLTTLLVYSHARTPPCLACLPAAGRTVDLASRMRKAGAGGRRRGRHVGLFRLALHASPPHAWSRWVCFVPLPYPPARACPPTQAHITGRASLTVSGMGALWAVSIGYGGLAEAQLQPGLRCDAEHQQVLGCGMPTAAAAAVNVAAARSV